MKTFKIELSDKAASMIRGLKRGGLHGKTDAEVVAGLVLTQLREMRTSAEGAIVIPRR